MSRSVTQWWQRLRIQHKVWAVLLLLCVPLIGGLATHLYFVQKLLSIQQQRQDLVLAHAEVHLLARLAVDIEDGFRGYVLTQQAPFLTPLTEAEALAQGVPQAWLDAAKRSPIYKMAVKWRVALPLHPEYRTLPMVWYVPPLSPIQSAAEAGRMAVADGIPDVRQLRIPVKYLANLLTAGEEQPVVEALSRMLAMRAFMRARTVEGRDDRRAIDAVGMSAAEVEDMYQLMAIANYEDRFVIPTAHREYAENAYDVRGACGFSFGNGCSGGVSETGLFGKGKQRPPIAPAGVK